MNDNENNYQTPNNNENNRVLEDYGNREVPATNVNILTPPTVAPPVVTPPNVNTNNTISNSEEGDNRILKPITPEVEILENTIHNGEIPKLEDTLPTKEEATPVQPDVIIEKNGKDTEKPILENTPMEEVKIEYKPPGRFKTFLLILLFLIFFAVVFFLPDITEFVDQYKNRQTISEENNNSKIVSGTLSCDLDTNNDRFDLIYTYEFYYTNNKLHSLNFTDTIKGDRTLDSEELDLLYSNCKALSQELDNVSGVSISCDLFDGTLNRSQKIDFTVLNADSISSIYKKYDIKFPENEKDQNIDTIEREMQASGYTCERTSDN